MRAFTFAIIALVLFSACNQQKPGENPVKPAGDTVAVKLLPIGSDTSDNLVTTSGTISTEEVSNLSFKIGGIIESINVKEGDKVKKGQLLATLKSNEIVAQVQQAQLAFDKAKRDYDRAKNLYADSVVTLEQLQNAKTGLDIADESRQQVLFNQQYSRIYASADGFIALKRGNPGELAAPGVPVIVMNMASNSSRWVLKAGLSDADWAAIDLGNKATVKIDAFPSEKFTATVTKKSLAADPQSGSFLVELRVDLQKSQPASGMFASAVITPSKPTKGFRIPYDALLEANGKKGYVFVSDDRKTVKRVEVTIADINQNTVSIKGGLEGHAFIVVSGSPYLNDESLITAL